jgi:hypothetical protein
MTDRLRERIRSDLDTIAPRPGGYERVLERAGRRQRRRRVRAGALGVGLTLTLLAGLWVASERRPDRAPASDTSAAWPAADRLFLAGDGEAWVVHPATASVTRLDAPGLPPGDPPYRIARRGDALVAWAYRTLVLDPVSGSTTRLLASDSLIFLPSAQPDRVWVGIADDERADGGLTAVREIAVDGTVTVQDTPPPGGRWPVAAVEDDLVFQGDGGLFMWDPRTGTVVGRLPGDLPVAWQRSRLAWCADACDEIHVTDRADGSDLVVSPPAGTVGFEALHGAFSPDGTTLAVALRLGGGPEAPRQLGLIDVATGEVRAVDGTRVDTPYVFVDWSPSGRSVYLTGGQIAARRIVGYVVGEPAGAAVPVRVGDFYGMAVVPVA